MATTNSKASSGSMEASKKSLSEIAAASSSSASKSPLKSKWMATYEHFVMVRLPIYHFLLGLSPYTVNKGFKDEYKFRLTFKMLFSGFCDRDKTQVTNQRIFGTICSCLKSTGSSSSSNCA